MTDGSGTRLIGYRIALCSFYKMCSQKNNKKECSGIQKLVILIDLNCFLLSFSYFGKTHQQSAFDSNDCEQFLTVVFFTPVVTFHFVTDTFTFKKGDFRGMDQQARSPRKEIHIRHKCKHFCKQHAMLQIPCPSLVSRLVGLSTVEGSRSVVFGGGGESLLSCRPAGCLQTTAILLPPTLLLRSRGQGWPCCQHTGYLLPTHYTHLFAGVAGLVMLSISRLQVPYIQFHLHGHGPLTKFLKIISSDLIFVKKNYRNQFSGKIILHTENA